MERKRLFGLLLFFSLFLAGCRDGTEYVQPAVKLEKKIEKLVEKAKIHSPQERKGSCTSISFKEPEDVYFISPLECRNCDVPEELQKEWVASRELCLVPTENGNFRLKGKWTLIDKKALENVLRYSGYDFFAKLLQEKDIIQIDKKHLERFFVIKNHCTLYDEISKECVKYEVQKPVVKLPVKKPERNYSKAYCFNLSEREWENLLMFPENQKEECDNVEESLFILRKIPCSFNAKERKLKITLSSPVGEAFIFACLKTEEGLRETNLYRGIIREVIDENTRVE